LLLLLPFLLVEEQEGLRQVNVLVNIYMLSVAAFLSSAVGGLVVPIGWGYLQE